MFDVCQNLDDPIQAKKMACQNVKELAQRCHKKGFNIDWRSEMEGCGTFVIWR